MALTSVSLNDGVHVQGRIFARNGKISLINDVTRQLQAASTGRRADGNRTDASGPDDDAGHPRADSLGRRSRSDHHRHHP